MEKKNLKSDSGACGCIHVTASNFYIKSLGVRLFLNCILLIAFCHFWCVSRECTTCSIPGVNFFCMPKYFYHMAESMSREDQVNPVS